MSAATAISCARCHNGAPQGGQSKCDDCLAELAQSVLAKVNTRKNDKPKPEDEETPLVMPPEAMYGKMGEWATALKMPIGLGYPALIGVYSIKPEMHRMLGTTINTYVALIAKPEAGKNQAIKRAMDMLDVDFGYGHYASNATVGGDLQLAILLGDKPGKKRGDPRIAGHRKLLLVNPELTDVLKKTSLESSTLAPRMCDLWDVEPYQKPHGENVINVDCRLSWIGGIPADTERPDRFRELFGSETNYGLYPRFIFGYSGVKFNYRQWEKPEDTMEFYGSEMPMPVSQYEQGVTTVQGVMPEAQAMYDAWNPHVDNIGRLRHNLMKVAILTSSANSESSIQVGCMRSAIRFMEWQVAIRTMFKPSDATGANREAQFAERLIPCLERSGASNKYVSWRRIALNNHWDTMFDPGLQLKAVKNLIAIGRLIPEPQDENEQDSMGRKKKKKEYPSVRLRAMNIT